MRELDLQQILEKTQDLTLEKKFDMYLLFDVLMFENPHLSII